MSEMMIGVLGLIVLLVMISLRLPIALALGTVGVVGVAILRGPTAAFGFERVEPFGFTASWTLSAVPTFLLMGYLAYHTGLTSGLFYAGRLWLSALPGGLAISSVFACAGFAAACGSSAATSAAMGRIAVPEMLKYGYKGSLAAGTIASAGTLGVLIPPSIVLVIYGVFAEVSVGKVLLAGFLPGVLSAVMYSLMIMIRCKLNPGLAPALTEEFTWGDRFRSLLAIWPLPVLIVGVIGGIYSGIVTPTEAGAAGALLALIMALATRRLSWASFREALSDTVRTTSTILFIAVGAILFLPFMNFSGIPRAMTDFVLGANLSPLMLIIAVAILIIFWGMFLDAIGLMLIFLPIIVPIFLTVGIDMIWFGIILVKLIEIGMVTPPVGINVYVVKGVTGDAVSLEDIFKGIGWFVITDVLTIVILIIFPIIALLLPNTMRAQ